MNSVLYFLLFINRSLFFSSFACFLPHSWCVWSCPPQSFHRRLWEIKERYCLRLQNRTHVKTSKTRGTYPEGVGRCWATWGQGCSLSWRQARRRLCLGQVWVETRGTIGRMTQGCCASTEHHPSRAPPPHPLPWGDPASRVPCCGRVLEPELGGAASNRLRVPEAGAAKRERGAGLFLHMHPCSRALEGDVWSAAVEGNAPLRPPTRAQHSAPDKGTPEGQAADRQTHLGPSEARPNPARYLPARTSSASTHRANVSGTKSQTALHIHIPQGQLSRLTQGRPRTLPGVKLRHCGPCGEMAERKQIARCGVSDPGRPHPETAAPAYCPKLWWSQPAATNSPRWSTHSHTHIYISIRSDGENRGALPTQTHLMK